jgi:hypothetical protein
VTVDKAWSQSPTSGKYSKVPQHEANQSGQWLPRLYSPQPNETPVFI